MTPSTLVLSTRDTAFAGLCEHLLVGAAELELLVTVSTVELLEVVRQHDPDLVLLDVDGHDLFAMRALASKLTIVSEARLVLASAYLSPGSPGLSALLSAVVASFVEKPRGAAALSLSEQGGADFVAALTNAGLTHARSARGA